MLCFLTDLCAFPCTRPRNVVMSYKPETYECATFILRNSGQKLQVNLVQKTVGFWTCMVKFHYKLRYDPHSHTTMRGEWRKFINEACITFEFLRHFSEHCTDFFTADNFLKLMKDRLIVTDLIGKDEYFTPFCEQWNFRRLTNIEHLVWFHLPFTFHVSWYHTWDFLFLGGIASIFIELYSLETVSLSRRLLCTTVFDKKLHQVPTPRRSTWITHTDWHIHSFWSPCWRTIWWCMCSLLSVTANSFQRHSESSRDPRLSPTVSQTSPPLQMWEHPTPCTPSRLVRQVDMWTRTKQSAWPSDTQVLGMVSRER